MKTSTKDKSRVNDYTPREVAHSIALEWLRAAWMERTDDLNSFNLTPGALRNAKKQIVKLHNKLLEQSGLDGTFIEED